MYDAFGVDYYPPHMYRLSVFAHESSAECCSRKITGHVLARAYRSGRELIARYGTLSYRHWGTLARSRAAGEDLHRLDTLHRRLYKTNPVTEHRNEHNEARCA